MKKSKFITLNLVAGIHTVDIKTTSIPISIPSRLFPKCIKNKHISKNIDTEKRNYKTIINPNKYKSEIISLEDFERTMESIKRDLRINFYDFTRIDFSIDNFEIGSFEKYLKINRWALMIMVVQHKARSKYLTKDMMTEETLTLRLDTEYIQVEYYNKNIESNGSSPVQARLELRSKGLIKTNRGTLEEIKLWCVRLRAIPKGSKKLQNQCNKDLLRKWRAQSASGAGRSLIEFIRNNEHKIFTDRQLVELCLQLGTTAKYARELKYKAGIVTYKESDLEEFIEIIVEELVNFTVNKRK